MVNSQQNKEIMHRIAHNIHKVLFDRRLISRKCWELNSIEKDLK